MNVLLLLLSLSQLQGEVSYPSAPDLAVGAVIVDNPGGWLVFKQQPFEPTTFTPINEGAGVIFEGAPGKYIIFFFPPGQAIPQPQVTIKTLGGASVPPPVVDPPLSKVRRATYVYEKNQNPVPPAVAAALRALNEGRGPDHLDVDGISTSEFEQNNVNADGDVPEQYVQALKAAKEAGLPALVIESDDAVLRVMTNPTTEEDVYRACEPSSD